MQRVEMETMLEEVKDRNTKLEKEMDELRDVVRV